MLFDEPAELPLGQEPTDLRDVGRDRCSHNGPGTVIAFRSGGMGEYDANGRGVSSPHAPRTGRSTTNVTGWGGSSGTATWGDGVVHSAED